ncbi:transposase family protein, partial [Salinisphaera hydrothermalis C41B8]
MHASAVLQTWLASVFSGLDQRNVQTTSEAVCACLNGQRLTLMTLARHSPDSRQIAAPLKRLDRWLSNRSMQAHRRPIYRASAACLVSQDRPVVIVDWSELPRDGQWQLLRASIPRQGRALTLYDEVHPQRHLNSRAVHDRFLQRLQAILPASCRPIVLTDAGFHTPWFRSVEALGWDWIGRLRGRVMIRDGRWYAAWRPVSAYYDNAPAKPESLGICDITRSRPTSCYLVRTRRQPRGRHQTRRDRQRAGGGKAEKMARRYREPWVLAASCGLADERASEIARLYGLRIQIETAFRDLKSHQYGSAFEDTQTRVGARLEMLLLIHMLATLVAWLAALATRSEHETRFRISLPQFRGLSSDSAGSRGCRNRLDSIP